MNNLNEDCIILFVKYPAPGNVKSRLAEDIGTSTAVDIYKCFVQDILNTLSKQAADVIVFYDAFNSKLQYEKWMGVDYRYEPQGSGDLGDRMDQAFKKCFEMGYRRAVLIGSDTPDLPESISSEAFNQIDLNDVVIGPANDGGYYLIGFGNDSFNETIAGVFDGIEWSSDNVLSKSMDFLEKEKRSVYLLPKWSDVDTINDLRELVERNRKSSFSISVTMSWIKEREEILNGKI